MTKHFDSQTRRRAVRAITLALGMALVITSVLPTDAHAQARPFSARFSANDTGDIAIVANTLVTCQDFSGGPSCAGAQNGTNTGTNPQNNNGFPMLYVDVDGDGSTFNSSTATLGVPTGATVLFAGLYWGADSTAGSAIGGIPGAAPPNAAARNQVKFATPATGGTSTSSRQSSTPSRAATATTTKASPTSPA